MYPNVPYISGHSGTHKRGDTLSGELDVLVGPCRRVFEIKSTSTTTAEAATVVHTAVAKSSGCEPTLAPSKLYIYVCADRIHETLATLQPDTY